MTNVRVFSRSFAGGEVTPEFFGRIDEVSNITGLQRCRNFRVLPHGPVENRTGSQFVKEVKDSTKSTRLVRFSYSDNQTFVIELGAGYFRFHTQGATLQAGTVTAYNGATAYEVGDLASSGGVNYYCIAATTGNAPPNATYWYPMPADGTFEIPNDYAEADLFEINYVQSQDVMTFTHPNNPPMELRRNGATDWTFIEIAFASDLDAPANITATATVGSGSETYTYTVTAVDETGREEGLQGTPDDVTNDLLADDTYKNTITWDAVTGASRYNVYKLDNGLYGYIGQTTTTSFVDQNITADVSKTPPIAQDPFDSTDNYPRAVSYYEQRRDFGGTNNNPQNIWMTRAGTESNMAFSIPTRDTDAINFRIAAREENTVRHLVPLVDLLVLTSSAAWMVTSVNSDSIAPDSIAVRPQAYVGASTAQPVVIDNVVLFAAARGGHLRALGFSAERNAYIAKDLSLRAPHLFNNLSIVDITHVQAPYQMAFCTSSNGILIGLTYVPDEEISALHWHDTYTNAGDTANPVRSLFKSVCAVAEGDEDFLYAVIERVIDGSTVKYIERFQTRNFEDLHDAYFVDCGVTYDSPVSVTNITKADPGVVTTDGAHGFDNDDPVDFLGVVGMTDVNNNRYYVANKTSTTFELVDQYGDNIDTSDFGTYVSGGEVRKALSTISSGLDHIEGETVSILGNGAVQPQKTVTGGEITLDTPASIIHVGLPVESDLQTLPMAHEKIEAYAQGRRKNVNKIWVRVHRSSGIFAGPSFDKLVEIKQRTDEVYGLPPNLKSEELTLTLTPSWGDNGVVCLRQADPLPLTLVSMTAEVSIGS